MKKVLVLGAGRSATTLIKYLLDHAESEDWQVTVGDFNMAAAEEKVAGNARGRAIRFDVYDESARKQEIAAADLVISLLPPQLHVLAARDCVADRTHLVTASYVSEEMAALDGAAREAGVLLLNEVGADPGIDHMSAMEMIHGVRERGGVVRAFRSYCGALVTPESSNLWGYKFTWAPRNIVLAGQGVAKYLKNDRVKYLPYHSLFRRTDVVEVPGMGPMEAYANRDSLKYVPLYGLEHAHTIYRATLRYEGFCTMWNAFVELGFTDAGYKMTNSEGMSYRDFLFSFINALPGKSDRESLAAFLRVSPDSVLVDKLAALDLFSDRLYMQAEASPADFLEQILSEKWVFEEDDVDMVVMQHNLEYELEGKLYTMQGSMVDRGRDHDHTAISRTVGLPVAMSSRLILRGEVPERGVQIPNFKNIYLPVMKELEDWDIRFVTEDSAFR